MHEIDLDLEPNEASDLCPLTSGWALEANGWDLAFVTVLDETAAEESIAVLGHAAGAPPHSGWSARRVPTTPQGPTQRTEDAEACATRDGWLYALGSQFGKKSGPLSPRRSWIARLREDELASALAGGPPPRLEIVRLRFGLHRAVNDVLAETALELIELGPESREAYIEATIERGERKSKRWAGRVRHGDHPINVEGAEFRGNGNLLLGLRYPVSADGCPLLVELEDVDALFDDPGSAPVCRNVWVLTGAGSIAEPRGVRALEVRPGDRFDAIVGNLDAAEKGATLLSDRPQGHRSDSVHVRFSLPLVAGGGATPVEQVHEFDDATKRIEGIAHGPDDHTYYVIDEDGRVGLRAMLLD